MKHFWLILIIIFTACEEEKQEPELSIDRILSKPSITGTSPTAPSWSPDSQHLAFLWNDTRSPGREVWIVKGDGSGLRQLTSKVDGEEGVKMFAWTPNAEDLIYARLGDLWHFSLDSGEEKRLTNTGGNKSNLAVSPNGQYASYLQDGDLWVFNLKNSMLAQRTRVGVPTISKVPLGR